MIFNSINNIFTYIFNIRNYFSSRFIGSINNNKLYKYSYTHILPAKMYTFFITDPYIYKLDNRYYISNNKFSIIPIIEEIKLVNDNNEIIITDIIKKYDNFIQLWVVLLIENFNDYNKIFIKIKKNLSIKEYKYNIIDIKYYKLYEIYNNKIRT